MDTNLFIGRTCVKLDRVDSTNNYARDLVRDKLPIEGTVIIANEQTNGRGQRSNSWVSEPKSNLTCSYILKPVFLSAKNQFALSAAVAIAVKETVAALLGQEQIAIKWPNDVLVNDRKIAGILIENTLRGDRLENSIVGIGINLNQTDFPPRLNATSVRQMTNKETDRERVLTDLSTRLEKHYLTIRKGDLDEVMDRLNGQLYGTGERKRLIINGTEEMAMVVEVDLSGTLRLKRNNGRITEHLHHEISWV